MGQDKEIIKDFSDYYKDRIALSLENIRTLKINLLTNPRNILDMNTEIEDIYIKIRPKLINNKLTKYSKREDKFEKIMGGLIPLEIKKSYDRIADNHLRKIIKTPQYNKYVYLLRLRERHIWECLEALGMTSKEKETGKLVG